MPNYLTLAREIIHNCLQRELPEHDVHILAQFIPIANDDILRKSLKELNGAVKNAVPADMMQRVHRVYNRKLAEMTRFYPALHIFETSYRTFVSYMMADIYKIDDWWRDFHIHAVSLDTRDRLPRPTAINGNNLSSNVSDAVYDFSNIIKLDRDASKLIEAGSTHQLLQYCNLSHIENLILSDWQVSKNYFVSEKPITSTNFQEMFTVVRNARNAIFHHRDIPNRPKLVSHLIELLDLIGVHLPSHYDDVLHQAGQSIDFSSTKERHHFGLNPTREKYTITYKIGVNEDMTQELLGHCESEAIMSFMHSHKSVKIAQLNSIQVAKNETPA